MKGFRSLAEMILARAQRTPRAPAFRVRKGPEYVDVPWGEVADRIDVIAAGLLAAGGLEPGTRVAIAGSTSLDWVLVDYACLSVGLQTVPIYASLLPAEVGYMLVDTDARLAIVEDAAQLRPSPRRFRATPTATRPTTTPWSSCAARPGATTSACSRSAASAPPHGSRTCRGSCSSRRLRSATSP